MNRARLLITCVTGIGLLVWPSIAAELRPHQHRPDDLLCTLIALPGNAFTTVPAPPQVNDGRFRPDAVAINVNYTGFTPQAQAAFQYAIDIWKTQVTSSVPVTVNATFTGLPAGVLGSAGFNQIARDFVNAPVSNTWFPMPIANALAGTSQSPSTQISAQFSSTFAFYFGTDGLPPSGQYDFVTVVLHELGHGLGFAGSMSMSGTTGLWGTSGFPYIYDRLVVNGSAQSLISAFPNNSTALGAQLTSNSVFWNGTYGVAANSGVRPKLYAPTTWSSGSSIAHLDDATFPAGTANSLMTHAISAAEAIHNPGPVTRGIFLDSGWTLDTGVPPCTYSLSAPSFTIGNPAGTGTVGVTTSAGCTWTAVSNDSFITITGGASGTGSGIVTYSVPANTGPQRSGTITIAGQQVFTLTQSAACTYTLSSPSFTIGQPGGPGTVGVTTTSGCAWTAVSNDTGFITVISGASGIGSGIVTYSVPPNTGAQRSGTITIAGQTFTLTQSAAPTCTYTLSATAFGIGNASTNGSVGVTTGAGCPWTAVSNDAFIIVTSAASSTGSGLVTYSAAQNTGPVRTGTITIAGQIFTLTQGPMMSVDRSRLAFGATNSAGTLNNITSAQAVTVTFGGVSPTWIATTTTPWLQINGGSGTGNGQFTVSVRSAAGLPATGPVSGSVSIVSGGVSNSPLTLPITLTLFANTSTTAAPFGSFDTPAAGALVEGSIAVTGWALDDIEVVRVAIWRDLVPGETTPPNPGPGLGTGKVYIADALFINGARPDVEAGYPGAPYAYRAGWGYLMLTWGLWNQGNSPFTFYAFAYDRDGHGTSLGFKTVNVSNGTATRPFGSIDVPAYGQTMTSNFYNFGWALTPNATPSCSIGASGVQVSIDSGPLVSVPYGDARPDIASGFPSFTNSSGAGGAYFIDTSILGNGTHLIGWFVTDDCGRADGIGSRFFNVLNAGQQASGLAGHQASGPSGHQAIGPSGHQAVLADAALLDAPVEVHRGQESTLVYPGLAGDRVVAIGQSERVEVQLPRIDGARYSGYQIVNGEHQPLPLGSSLDAEQGIFYWQPAAGFLGSFQLEFVTSPDGAPVRVRAVVGTSVQAAIDTPFDFAQGRPQAGDTAGAFTIAGWAIDLAATSGTGIDAVHVWAYPATGASPIFLGEAAYGEGRPDIGALFGAQFTGSSFSLPVAGLAPGTYDVVIYPHSAVAGDFRGAQVVRVRIP